jgi:hypothetical protein
MNQENGILEIGNKMPPGQMWLLTCFHTPDSYGTLQILNNAVKLSVMLFCWRDFENEDNCKLACAWEHWRSQEIPLLKGPLAQSFTTSLLCAPKSLIFYRLLEELDRAAGILGYFSVQ